LEQLHQGTGDVEQHDHRGLAPGFESARQQHELDRDRHQRHEIVAPERRIGRPEHPGRDQQDEHQRTEQARPGLLHPEPEQLVREYGEPAAARGTRRDAAVDAVPAEAGCTQCGDHEIRSMGIPGLRSDISDFRLARSTWTLHNAQFRLIAGPPRGSAPHDEQRESPVQYIYTMINVSKIVPPKREIIKDISLSFFPGAKIGLLGVNGAGKSTVLRIMAGVDPDFQGEARPAAGINIGYLAQEPQLDPDKTVREAVEEGMSHILDAQKRLDEIYAAYAEEGADFDALAAEQQKLENILAAGDAHTMEMQLEVAADALRLPPWDAKIGPLSGGEKRRVALCRLLLSKPDMLLLDEPTNHLDAESVDWLEQFLHDYPGTVVAVTHDRYFLDNAAEWILELA